jgi:hypothetical protein
MYHSEKNKAYSFWFSELLLKNPFRFQSIAICRHFPRSTQGRQHFQTGGELS